MTQNVERILGRGENLDHLRSKTEDLEATSEHFKTTSQRVAQKFWWKNVKMIVLICVIVFIIILFTIHAIPTETPPPTPPSSLGQPSIAGAKKGPLFHLVCRKCCCVLLPLTLRPLCHTVCPRHLGPQKGESWTVAVSWAFRVGWRDIQKAQHGARILMVASGQ
ncbi:synaptobrevin-like [Canis lupus dingo]|uniref:synaptobrevin-like n=1 Tax=Canis lupus dingo TaxID=286419 RepID=UPI000DC6A2BF|nr:synaptobrevin-like [Canis lupus dingo]